MPVSLLGRLLLLRANPQDLPTSVPLMVAMLVASAGADALGATTEMSFELGIVGGAITTLTLVAFVQVLLRLHGFDNRTTQTLTALAACNAVLTFGSWAVAMALAELAPRGAVYLLSLVWYLTVAGHVLRHAIDRAFAVGVMLALLYFLIASTLVGISIGQPVTTN
jgi:hypothetical protein